MNKEKQPQIKRTAKQSQVVKDQMAKKAACRKKVKENFKSIDYFGQSVSFTWNGEDQFKTTFGATVSLILMLILLAYGIDRFVKVIQRDSPVVTTTTMIRSQDEDYPYTPFDSGFDFAFGLSNTLDKSIGYFTLKQIFNNYNESNGPTFRTKKSFDLDFGICGTNFDYPDQEEVQKFGISNMQCIKENNYYLQGNFYRSHMKYVEIKLWKCQNSTINKIYPGQNIICQSQATIDNFFNSQQFSFAFINNLFDANNFESPVQPYIDDSLFFEIDTTVSKKANFFVQLANASLTDNIFPITADDGEMSFHQVQNIRTYEDNYANNDEYLIAIYIRYDRSYIIYTRTVSDLLTWLGDIGGLQGTLLGIGMVIVGFITSKMFMSKIVRQIYQIRKYENYENKQETLNSNSARNKINAIQQDDEIGPDNKYQLPSNSWEFNRNDSHDFKQKENALQQEFKNKKKLKEPDVADILYAFINRTRFKYTIKDILTFITKCMCMRKVEKNRKQKQFKKHFLFQKAEDKFMQELDVVRIVKTMRKFKMLAQAMLSQKHRLVLRFQRQNLIETSSSSSDSDNNAFDTARLMEQPNPLIRLVMFGKLKKMMMSFTGKKVDSLERNMMRGMYIRKLKDFSEEMREHAENHTLLSRLLDGLPMDEMKKLQRIKQSQITGREQDWKNTPTKLLEEEEILKSQMHKHTHSGVNLMNDQQTMQLTNQPLADDILNDWASIEKDKQDGNNKKMI